MKLEASPEVLRAVASALYSPYDFGAAERAYCFVRDYVLEEAAKMCDAMDIDSVYEAAENIRAMKGTP